MREQNLKNTQQYHTLDIKHRNKLTKISKEQEILNEKRNNLCKLEKEYDKLNSKKKILMTDAELNKLMEIKDKIIILKNEIDRCKRNKEIDYYNSTASILFDYYESIEKNENDNGGAHHIISENSILNFFNNNDKEEDIEKIKEKEETKTYNRAKLLEEYIYNTDKNYAITYYSSLQNNDFEKCYLCESENICMVPDEGIKICNDCNSIDYILTDSDKPSYKDPPKEISYFAYKRIEILVLNSRLEKSVIC